MRCPWFATILGLSVLVGVLGERHASAQQAGWKLRVQSLSSARDVHQIAIPGYRYHASSAFSADGEWIAFNAYQGGAGKTRSEVWIVRRDGKGLKKLTSGATPRWSPDGKRLLFKRDDYTNPEAEPGIYVIHRDGTGEKFICSGRWPDWSPDGERIVFSRGGAVKGGAVIGSKIYVAEPDGSDAEMVCQGDCPSWSPDVQKIACCVHQDADENAQIRVFDLETRKTVALGPGWLRPNWWGDSRSLVVNGGAPKEHSKLTRYFLDRRKKPQPLVRNVNYTYEPCVSRDGEYLVFSVYTR